MGDISLFEILLAIGLGWALGVSWALIVQRRFNRDVVTQFRWMEEMVEDAGWNWERDDLHTRGCVNHKSGWEPANSNPSVGVRNVR